MKQQTLENISLSLCLCTVDQFLPSIAAFLRYVTGQLSGKSPGLVPARSRPLTRLNSAVT